VYETLKRDGPARMGLWSWKERELRTPALLFTIAEGGGVPPQAKAILTGERLETDALQVVKAPGPFSGGGEGDIPSYFPYPHTLDDDEKNEGAENDVAFVLTKEDDETLARAKASKAELVVWTHGLSLINRSREFASVVSGVRAGIGSSKLLYAPGLALPHRIPFLIGCGIDVLDTTSVELATAAGNFLTPHGPESASEMEEPPCHCPACTERGEGWLRLHNLHETALQLKLTRTWMRKGRLRELVERTVGTEPWLVEALRHLDRHHLDAQETYYPVNGPEFFCPTPQSLHRPDVERWRARLRERYAPPEFARVLLLLPCSAKKPYSRSRSHRSFRWALENAGDTSAVHEVIVTSPLGLVPRELELFYPARQYDIPVTHHWSGDERAMIREMLDWLTSFGNYQKVLVHFSEDERYLFDGLAGAEFTSPGRPTAHESLDALTEALKLAVEGMPKVGRKQRMGQEMLSRTRFQFGDAGSGLMDGAVVKGRYPNVRLLRDNEQLGILVGERGMLSLTPSGAKVLADASVYTVTIGDFEPKGNIFAIGVEGADPAIRSGDDVAVVKKDGTLVGVGVAQMYGAEMVEMARGEAVRVRSVVKK